MKKLCDVIRDLEAELEINVPATNCIKPLSSVSVPDSCKNCGIKSERDISECEMAKKRGASE